MARYLYSELASAVGARLNCERMNNDEWFHRHGERIESLVREHMPSGSGFDHGTKIDLERSHADRLVFHTSYHHMHESGMYDGWTDHTVTVTPSFIGGFNIRVSGRNRNNIKDHITETFAYDLRTEIEEAG